MSGTSIVRGLSQCRISHLATSFFRHMFMSSPLSSRETKTTSGDKTVSKISLLSWNIDGIDKNKSDVTTRFSAAYDIVSRINADFVFLQEVVEQDIDKLINLKKFYNVFFSNRQYPYFTAILVSNVFSVRNHEVIPFHNSVMGRTLQIVEGTLGPFHVFLLTTHLESMKDNFKPRREQLKQCLNTIASISNEHPNALIFFGGDLNLRDKEFSGLPSGFADAWLASGASESERFTWDTKINKNKKDFLYPVSCRFDRIFYKAQPFNKVSFVLEGKELIREDLYPSDHWAMHSTFSL